MAKQELCDSPNQPRKKEAASKPLKAKTNVGAANLRLGQGGRIIDAVARHRHKLSQFLEAFYRVRLLIGQHFGHYLTCALS